MEQVTHFHFKLTPSNRMHTNTACSNFWSRITVKRKKKSQMKQTVMFDVSCFSFLWHNWIKMINHFFHWFIWTCLMLKISLKIQANTGVYFLSVVVRKYANSYCLKDLQRIILVYTLYTINMTVGLTEWQSTLLSCLLCVCDHNSTAVIAHQWCQAV